jgi:hypothetical protein
MWFCNLVPESVTTALLEKGGGVNVHDGYRETPLHHLVRRRDPPFGLLREFIAKEVNVNEIDGDDQSW